MKDEWVESFFKICNLAIEKSFNLYFKLFLSLKKFDILILKCCQTIHYAKLIFLKHTLKLRMVSTDQLFCDKNYQFSHQNCLKIDMKVCYKQSNNIYLFLFYPYRIIWDHNQSFEFAVVTKNWSVGYIRR